MYYFMVCLDQEGDGEEEVTKNEKEGKKFSNIISVV